MRLKSVIKYNLSEIKASIVVFYGVMLAVIALLGVSFIEMSNNNTNGNMGGAEVATVIFIFVVGLNSFKNNYLFLSTNGISRKTQFKGFASSAFIICILLAAIDNIYLNILPLFMDYGSLFSQIYTPWAEEMSKVQVILTGFVWSIAVYFMAIAAGYFITVLYYRMNKLLKTVVSIAVPALLCVVLPVIDVNYAGGKISGFVSGVFKKLAGFNGGIYPMIGVLSMAAGAIIFLGLAYLLVRRARIKD